MRRDPHSNLTLANQITILRIILIPAIVIGLLYHRNAWVYGILIFSMVTDLLDGLVARWRKEKTKLGAFLDPLADKLLLTAVFMTMTYMGIIETWVFVIVFSRDLLIVLGWAVIFILTGSSSIKPRPLGKTTTALQMAMALSFLLEAPMQLRAGLLWIAIGLTVASAVDYIREGEKRLGGGF